MFALRTIEVSERAAMRRAPDLGPEGVERVRMRTIDCSPGREGDRARGHGEVLAAIEYLRQTVGDHRAPTPAPGERGGRDRVH